MRIFIATDAWRPQVNGVVRTYENLRRELEAAGHAVTILSPLDFATLPCPGYAEIRLALPRRSVIAAHLNRGAYDHVHIATEGPIGWATRSVCLRRGIRFTTSYHTRFPEYVEAYTGVPAWLSYAVQKRFHRPAVATLVATPSLKDELGRRGFNRLMLWPRGVDTLQFRPGPTLAAKRKDPTFLYVGRVSREKNIEAFLDLDLPGRKVVVGDGPLLPVLRKRYPEAQFKGAMTGEGLALEYSAADVFVFPSRTDTFGLVLLEAMASGLAIAAYPVTGPIDVVTQGLTGILSEDLRSAALAALSLDRSLIRAQSMGHDWSRVADVFLNNICEGRRAGSIEKRVVKAKEKSPQMKPTARLIS
jgi:glycosyltransferase involved in cell wall biosynthesis